MSFCITHDIAASAVARIWARDFPTAFVPLAPAEWAEVVRPRTDRELAREVYAAEYGRARAAGFSPEKSAEVAAFEVKLAMRKTPATERHQPSRSRPDSALPHAGFQLVYDASKDRYVKTNFVHPERHGIARACPFPAEREAEHARFRNAEKEYGATVEAETGLSVEDNDWAERLSERRELLRQSHQIGNKLEAGGTIAYRSDEYQINIVSIFSEHVEQIPSFRHLCFIPHVAAMVRSKKVNALEYFLERHPFARFWTFTGGVRVPIRELRARIESLHKRINKLNKELRRRYGAELVFRSTELGTMETAESAGRARAKRAARSAHRAAVQKAKAAGLPAPTWTRAKEGQFDDAAGSVDRDPTTGEALFHPHVHAVLLLPCRMEKAVWSEMLSFVWKHWGDHWDDGKIIQDAREACKYVTKPGEIAALPVPELCALEKSLSGLRLVTPMGALKKEIRERKLAGQTLRRKRTPDGPVWAVVQDHNRCLSASEDETEFARAKRREERMDYLDAKARIHNPDTGELVSGPRPHEGAPRRKSSAAFCRVVARCVPAAVATPMKEPRVVVASSRGGFCLSRVRQHPLTVSLWQIGIEAWLSGKAIRVHTGTSTGEQRLMTLLADTDERFAPATEPVWEASRPCVPVGFN